MIYEKNLFKILCKPHVSEKVSAGIEKRNTITFKVSKYANKLEIKAAIYKLFKVEVNNVRTLIIKGKIKRKGKYIGRCNDWKKAYITLKKGQNLNFIDKTE